MKISNLFSKTFKTIVLVSGMLVSSLSFAADTTAVNENGVILSGYDTVSYFTNEKPVQGKSDISSVFNGAIYHFSSEKNRDLFKASPAKYAPQYGGFCAYGTTLSKKIPIDPQQYEVIDGKLFVQSGAKALELFQPEKAVKIINANKNWQVIKNTPADQL